MADTGKQGRSFGIEIGFVLLQATLRVRVVFTGQALRMRIDSERGTSGGVRSWLSLCTDRVNGVMIINVTF